MTERARSRDRRSAGFTLVELMVTVAIATILVTVATASYNTYVRKSHRTDAKTALLDLAGREEQFYSTTNTYSGTPSDLGYGASGATFPMTVGSGYYQVNVSFCNPTPGNLCSGSNVSTFTVSATAYTTDQQQDSQCLYFSVDNTGKQFSSNNLSGSGTDTTTTCWQQ